MLSVAESRPAVRHRTTTFSSTVPKRIALINLRLVRGVRDSTLGITTPFDVEHAIVGPAMFVVADQLPPRIGRERRLARARETEKSETRPSCGRPLAEQCIDSTPRFGIN